MKPEERLKTTYIYRNICRTFSDSMLNWTTKIIQGYLGEITVLNISYKLCQRPHIDYLVDDILPWGGVGGC